MILAVVQSTSLFCVIDCDGCLVGNAWSLGFGTRPTLHSWLALASFTTGTLKKIIPALFLQPALLLMTPKDEVAHPFVFDCNS